MQQAALLLSAPVVSLTCTFCNKTKHGAISIFIQMQAECGNENQVL